MGYEYYLLRPDNKTIFEFGKDRTGFLFALESYKQTPKKLPANLPELLLQSAKEYGWWEPDALNLEHMKKIADKVYAWAEGQPILLVGEGKLDLPDIETDNAARAAGKWVRQFVDDDELYTLTGDIYFHKT